ncbi:MAG: T9SS type A sorting domain-containing protein [Saprospiraceae bacterium]|nr:T9SS type A sorting domain-containing protein [Saprospiraceae bacterium]
MKTFSKIWVIFILFTTIEGNAQSETFSKLYPLKPFPASVFNAVLVSDTAYFITGIVADSVPPYGTKPLFVRTDTNGNIEIVHVHKDEQKDYETWYQGLYFDRNNKIVTNGYIFNNPARKGLFFIRYTQDGAVDTLMEFSHINIYGDLPYPMLQSQRNQFIVPVQSAPNNWGTNILFFLNNSGQVIKKNTYNPQNGNLLLIRMDTTRNGFVLGGWQAPGGLVKNGIHQSIIVEFDSLGNKIWEYESPIDEDWTGTLGGIVSNDKDEIIYVSGKGYLFDTFAISDVFKNKWYATKLRKDKKIIWRTSIPTFADISVEGSRFWNILKLRDNISYISMGMLADSITGIYSWITKFSDDGEILWNRNYKMESDTNGYQYEIRDMAEDKEGNLIAVGERLDLVRQGFNTQQGYLMKLDQYGCLTPGCHLVSTKDKYKEDFYLKIYPNPASDFISFYIDEDTKLNQYCIRDMKGQLIKGIVSLMPDIHYVIQTHDFISGSYIIQFLKDGHLVKSEKFIVSR